MVRVLHLSSTQPDFQSERGMAALAQAGGDEFQIERRMIGGGGDWRGMVLAWLAIRRNTAGQIEVLHSWDETGLMAAVAKARSAIIYSPSALPGKRFLRQLRWMMRFRNVRVVLQSEAERFAAIARGIDSGRCEVIAPSGGSAPTWLANESGQVLTSTDCPSPQPSPPGTGEREQEAAALSRAELRTHLGFHEEDYVLLAPGESTRSAGHRETLWAGSILHVLDRRYKVLLWGRGQMADACRRLGEKLNQPTLTVMAEPLLRRRVEYEELLAAADAVVFAPRGPTSLLPVRIASDAGLPVMATPSPWIAPELKARANWFEIERHSPRVLAQQVLKLRNGNVGRIEMAEKRLFDDVRRFAAEYRRLYQVILQT